MDFKKLLSECGGKWESPSGSTAPSEPDSFILFIDDRYVSVDPLITYFRRFKRKNVIYFPFARSALSFLLLSKKEYKKSFVECIFLDFKMEMKQGEQDDLNGLEFLDQCAANLILAPVIMLTAYHEDQDLHIKALDSPLVIWFAGKNVYDKLEIFGQMAERAIVFGGYLSSLERSVDFLDAKDPYTAEHSKNVARLSVTLAQKIWRGGAKTPSDVPFLMLAALFHDYGKIAIPDLILTKTMKPNDVEMRTLYTHAEYSYRLVKPIFNYDKALLGVLYNHRSYDGSHGYPKWPGYLGKEINSKHKIGTDEPVTDLNDLFSSDKYQFAHIIHVADCWDTMVSRRSYKDAMASRDALKDLVRKSRSEWCAGYEEDERGRLKFPDKLSIQNWTDCSPEVVKILVTIICEEEGWPNLFEELEKEASWELEVAKAHRKVSNNISLGLKADSLYGAKAQNEDHLMLFYYQSAPSENESHYFSIEVERGTNTIANGPHWMTNREIEKTFEKHSNRAG